MAFERIMSRLAGAQPATKVDAELEAAQSGLRGSGSWANEWSGAERSVERVKSLAIPAKTRRAAVEAMDGEHGVVEIRPLLEARRLQLHERLVDKLEVEAPTCSLHAGVAMSSFLKAARRPDGSDRLSDLTVDLLVVDGKGAPVVALIHEDTARPQRQILRVDALLDAGLPVVEIPPRGALSAIWSEIAPHLSAH